MGGPLDEVVLRSLEKEPAKRYQRASELKEEVSRYDGTPPPVEPAQPNGSNRDKKEQDVITVSCTIPTDWEGLLNYTGLLKLDGDTLVLQYRGEDGVVGFNLQEPREHRFPLKHIATMELKRGLTRHTISLTLNDLRHTHRLPGMTHGKVRLSMDKSDRAICERLMQLCQERGVHDIRLPSTTPREEVYESIRRPAIGMMVFAAVSFFSVFVLGSEWLKIESDNLLWTIASWAYVVTTLATQAFAFFGARRMFHVRSRSWGIAAAIACCAPMSPWAPFGIAMGIWALIVLNREEVAEYFREHSSGDGDQARREGKPPGDSALQLAVANQLKTPTTILRFCAQLSVLVIIFFGVGMGTSLLGLPNWIPITWSWRLVLFAALFAPNVVYFFARPQASRPVLLLLSVLALAPITPLWPITVVAGAWMLWLLSGANVRSAQMVSPLPAVGMSRSLLALLWAFFFTAVLVFAPETTATWRQGVVVTYEPATPISSHRLLREAESVLRRRAARAGLLGKIVLSDPSEAKFEWIGVPSEDQQLVMDRLATTVGRVELARVVRRPDPGGIEASQWPPHDREGPGPITIDGQSRMMLTQADVIRTRTSRETSSHMTVMMNSKSLRADWVQMEACKLMRVVTL